MAKRHVEALYDHLAAVRLDVDAEAAAGTRGQSEKLGKAASAVPPIVQSAATIVAAQSAIARLTLMGSPLSARAGYAQVLALRRASCARSAPSRRPLHRDVADSPCSTYDKCGATHRDPSGAG